MQLTDEQYDFYCAHYGCDRNGRPVSENAFLPISKSNTLGSARHGTITADNLKTEYIATLLRLKQSSKHGIHKKLGNGYKTEVHNEHGLVVEEYSLLSDRHGWELSHTTYKL